MKKKIFGVALIAAMALAASWNFKQSKNEVELSDLALANVEALARYEVNPDCPNVKHGYGRSTTLDCVNEKGETYTLDACDFDMGYSTDCEGRSAS